MGKFNLYKIPLKSLPEGSQIYEYQLDNQFFRNIDSTEVQRGKVSVVLTVRKSAETFELNFEIAGVIQIPCDRCLDYMDFEVATHERIYVKFGKEYSEESDDIVIVPETEGEINVAWFIYEFIALTIPLKHVHPVGKCNKAMSSQLKKHRAHIVGENDDDAEEDDGALYDDDDSEISEVKTDPRWDELKKIIDNN